MDWDTFAAHALVSRRALLEYGQLPTWNPYHCGGMSIPGNFQSRTYTPSFVLVLLFGPILGLRVWGMIVLGLGFEGGRRLARSAGAGPLGALFVGLAAAGNGHVMLHVSVGHLPLLSVLLAPWFLASLRSASEQPRRGVAAAGLWGGLMLLEGGLYPFVYTCLLAGLWALVEWPQRRDARAVGMLLASSAAALAVAAVIMLPSALYLFGQGARPVTASEQLPLSALPMVFLDADQSLERVRFAGQQWWWHEYGTYVGPFFFALVALGVARARRSSSVPWLILGLAFAVLALGDFGPLSPWRVLHHVPVFDSMRVPTRALHFTIVCWAMAASFGLDAWPRVARVGLALTAANLAVVLVPLSFAAFRQPVDLRPQPAPFRQHGDLGQNEKLAQQGRTTSTLDVLHERGDVDCYDPIVPVIAARALPPGQAEVELRAADGTTRGSVETVLWSPSRLVYRVESDEPVALIVNQNFDPGWVRSDDAPVLPAGGRLATPVAAGNQRVELSHRPLPFYLGLLVSLLAIAAALRTLAAKPPPAAHAERALERTDARVGTAGR